MAGEQWFFTNGPSDVPEKHLMRDTPHAKMEQLADGRYLVTKLKDKRNRIHIKYDDAMIHYDAINNAAYRRATMKSRRLEQHGYGEW